MNKKAYLLLIVLLLTSTVLFALPAAAKTADPKIEHPPICDVQYLEIYAVRCTDAGGDIYDAVVHFWGLEVPYEVFVTGKTASIFVYLPRDTNSPSDSGFHSSSGYQFNWQVKDKQGNVTTGSYR